MSAYIDAMMKGPRRGAAGPLWCHLIADTLDELHDFAQRIGLRRDWFQPHPRHSHYDIGSDRIRALAVRLGAIECDRRTFINHKRRIAGEPPLTPIVPRRDRAEEYAITHSDECGKDLGYDEACNCGAEPIAAPPDGARGSGT